MTDQAHEQAMRRIVGEAGQDFRRKCASLPKGELATRMQQLMSEAAALKKAAVNIDDFRRDIEALTRRFTDGVAPAASVAELETKSKIPSSTPAAPKARPVSSESNTDAARSKATAAAPTASKVAVLETSSKISASATGAPKARPVPSESKPDAAVSTVASTTPATSKIPNNGIASDAAPASIFKLTHYPFREVGGGPEHVSGVGVCGKERGTLLHGLFEATARRLPHFPAVQWKTSDTLTYAELDYCANAVAGWLTRRGAAPGVICALHMDRGLEMVVAIIGTLKSGAAYATLLPTWPLTQRLFVLEEAECPQLLTQSPFVDDYNGLKVPASTTEGDGVASPDARAAVEILVLDDCRAVAQVEAPPDKLPSVKATDLAYVIYTSGSTGKPKGVMMHHGGTASNIARNAGRSHREGTRSCFSNNYTFDVHVADVFKPLSVGGVIVVTRDIFRIPPVDVVSTLPNRVAQAKVPESLQCVIFTGEGITEASVRPIPVRTRVLNIFGATEFFDVTIKEIDRATFPQRLQSIGLPLPGISLWVMDPRTMALQPIGEAGELVVGGHQVAKGYIKRESLTAEKFFQAPWLKGRGNARVYRTGDLVRRCSDGEFEYLGRAVHQIEIRGHRFDLSTIESALCAIPGITEAAVVLKIGADHDEPQLAAYVSPTSATCLVDNLTSSLPQYMLPNVVVGIDTWPRTSSGKIDRNRLPAPKGSNGIEVCDVEPSADTKESKDKIRRRWMFRDANSDDKDDVHGDEDGDAVAPGHQTFRGEPAAPEPPQSPLASIPAERLSELEKFVRVQAYRRGIVVFKAPLPAPAELAPIALLPSPVSRAGFEQAVAVAPIFNRMIDAVACDVRWLVERLRSVCNADPWIGRLLDTVEEVYSIEGAGKDAVAEPRLYLSRQDYLPHADGRYLQTEINTIPAAFAGMTDQVSLVHADAVRKFCSHTQARLMEKNTPGRDFANAIANAHELYCDGVTPESREAKVCFVVLEGDELEMDQELIASELALIGVLSFRALLKDNFELRPAGPGGALYVNGTETSVVYFKCGHLPEHFELEEQWVNRVTIELSRAIKVPTLPAQLAGLKTVQKILCNSADMRHFLSEEETCLAARVVAQQFDFSQATGDFLASVMASPENWMLKLRHEDGGISFQGEELVQKLNSSSAAERSQYVLTEKLRAMPHLASRMHADVVTCSPSVGELGIFAAMLVKGDQEIINTVGGAMLRTRDAVSEDSGACSDSIVLDTPVFVSS